MAKILLVEDDPQITRSLGLNLKYSGFDLDSCANLREARLKISNQPYELLLLDVNLPDGTGLELCRELRQMQNDVPILFLSARTDEATVVESMKLGGDDYIRKPFGTEELKMRMLKIMRRVNQKRFLKAGPLVIDVNNRSAQLSGSLLNLGKREFEILLFLARRAGEVVSRESLLSEGSDSSEVSDRTIDSHMSHLRKKIRDAAGEALKITSIYGVGYRLEWAP